MTDDKCELRAAFTTCCTSGKPLNGNRSLSFPIRDAVPAAKMIPAVVAVDSPLDFVMACALFWLRFMKQYVL